jgi:antitoxin VapB
MTKVAKLFMNGRSQAVRLPAEFRFAADAKEVFIRKDPETGDVVLSSRPSNWDGFFAARALADVPDDFLSPEKRNQGIQDRVPFEGWEE